MSARLVVTDDHNVHPAPGDVVLDLERITAALGGTGPHVRLVALRALRAARETATRLREPVVVWDVRPQARRPGGPAPLAGTDA